jgi:hypothetical protein
VLPARSVSPAKRSLPFGRTDTVDNESNNEVDPEPFIVAHVVSDVDADEHAGKEQGAKHVQDEWHVVRACLKNGFRAFQAE